MARKLPPVAVSCNGCGGQFISRARNQVTVRCTHCGHACRVKRAAPVHAASQAVHTPATVTPAPAAAAAIPVSPGFSADDDDDGVCMYDRYGRLVLAEWTERGLVPFQGSPAQQAAELAVRGYERNTAARPGGCVITETSPAPVACGLAAAERFGPLPVCVAHYLALTSGLVVTVAACA